MFIDLGKIKAELAGPMGLDTDGDNPVQDDAKSETTETNIRPVIIQQPQTIQQQPFQPGSTPVHLMHRFMVRFVTVDVLLYIRNYSFHLCFFGCL